MKRAALALLLTLSAFAETTVIDSGSATDSNYSPAPGLTYAIPNPPAGLTDATMRYGPAFSYSIPAHNDWPYVVTLAFVEPTFTTVGQRIQSVRIGSQVVVDRLDLVAEAGFLRPLTRSVVVLASDGVLSIRVSSDIPGRNAVLSLISVRPLFELAALD